MPFTAMDVADSTMTAPNPSVANECDEGRGRASWRTKGGVSCPLGFQNFTPETGSYSGTQAASAAGRSMCNFGHLTGEKSPVPKRSEIPGNLAELSKGILRFAVSEFESWQPSQPVPSPCRTSVCRKCPRYFRALASADQSLTDQICSHNVLIGHCWRAVSDRKLSISEQGSRRLGSHLAETSSHIRHRARGIRGDAVMPVAVGPPAMRI